MVYPSLEKVQERLESGERWRIYVGFDPTAPQLHIGHALQLRKLAQFQELGHEIILLVGSFTAMIGDPTDKSATRVQLTQKEVLANAATYKKQAEKIIDFKGRNAAKVMFNHKWLGKMSFSDVVEVSSHFTVQQMSERDMFEKRMEAGKPVYLHEFLYPLMQGYDSVAMDVDMEIGGSDQTFNMLAGRTLMRVMKQKEKVVITTKLLTNDEGKKMSKSEGGFIALTDAPEEMYGKLMAMNDSMILPYFELATEFSLEEIDGMRIQMEQGVNPRDIKARLAGTIVEMYYDSESAINAASHFDTVFRKNEAPEDLEEVVVKDPVNIVDLLVSTGLASSKTEARRFVEQKAIKVDGTPLTSLQTELAGTKDGIVLQRGKRRFVKLVS
jgi:tyrosyl-tRNA synthetase